MNQESDNKSIFQPEDLIDRPVEKPVEAKPAEPPAEAKPAEPAKPVEAEAIAQVNQLKGQMSEMQRFYETRLSEMQKFVEEKAKPAPVVEQELDPAKLKEEFLNDPIGTNLKIIRSEIQRNMRPVVDRVADRITETDRTIAEQAEPAVVMVREQVAQKYGDYYQKYARDVEKMVSTLSVKSRLNRETWEGALNYFIGRDAFQEGIEKQVRERAKLLTPTSPSIKPETHISDDEKFMARRMDMTEDEWIKYRDIKTEADYNAAFKNKRA